jgi:hypothetical protein
LLILSKPGKILKIFNKYKKENTMSSQERSPKASSLSTSDHTSQDVLPGFEQTLGSLDTETTGKARGPIHHRDADPTEEDMLEMGRF